MTDQTTTQPTEPTDGSRHCRYYDCPEGYPLALEGQRVTCPLCRLSLALPALPVRDGGAQ